MWGFSDAIAEIVNVILWFCNTLLPSNVVAVIGTGFTIMIALAVKRAVLS